MVGVVNTGLFGAESPSEQLRSKDLLVSIKQHHCGGDDSRP